MTNTAANRKVCRDIYNSYKDYKASTIEEASTTQDTKSESKPSTTTTPTPTSTITNTEINNTKTETPAKEKKDEEYGVYYGFSRHGVYMTKREIDYISETFQEVKGCCVM